MWKRLVADDVKLEFHPGPHPPASQTKDVHVTAFVLKAFYPSGDRDGFIHPSRHGTPFAKGPPPAASDRGRKNSMPGPNPFGLGDVLVLSPFKTCALGMNRFRSTKTTALGYSVNLGTPQNMGGAPFGLPVNQGKELLLGPPAGKRRAPSCTERVAKTSRGSAKPSCLKRWRWPKCLPRAPRWRSHRHTCQRARSLRSEKTQMGGPGKWKHGLKPAGPIPGLILTHTQMAMVGLSRRSCEAKATLLGLKGKPKRKPYSIRVPGSKTPNEF